MNTGTRRVAMVAAACSLLLAAALAAELRATQQALQDQLAARNREAAAVLAAVLSRPPQDPAAWPDIARSQLGAGHTRRLRLLVPGQPAIELQRPPAVDAAPAWFRRALPLQRVPGSAALRLGQGTDGVVEAETDTAWAHDTLWDAYTRTGTAAALLLLASAAGLAWALRRQPTPPASGAEVASLAASLTRLQHQAQLDGVTGLPLRQPFLGQLQQRLDETGGAGLALLLVRVLDLEGCNLRLGRDTTDRLLGAVADVLQTYVDRVPGTLAGRLNGSDFALCLPVAGLAVETAASLRTALAAAPALRAAHGLVLVAGVDGVHEGAAGELLAAADTALARSEAEGGDDAGSVVLQAAAVHEVLGARAWRERLSQALDQGQVALAEEPVVDARGRPVRLDCTLQLRWRPDGEFEPSEAWRAQAQRGRLMPQVDLLAIDRALRACAQDGQHRALTLSRLSLSAPGFVADVVARLAAAPQAAQRLALEVPDGPRAGDGVAPSAPALAAWAAQGAQIGLVVRPSAATPLPALRAAGMHYLKVDAAPLRGLAHDDALCRQARGLVALAHGLGLSLTVSGVQDAADATALWALGVDAASGTGLQAEAGRDA